MSRIAIWMLRALLVLLAVPMLYVAAAVVLGLIAVNAGFRPTAAAHGGVAIYLRTNGVHAEFVVPVRAPYDWTHEFPPASLIDATRVAAPEDFGWLAFGWGDRDFYIATRTWRDLRLPTAWTALTGTGRGAMHVEYLARPEDYRALQVTVSQAQYSALVRYLRASFLRDADGRPKRIDTPGYFATDAFFEATDVYSAFFTCNEWVRVGLAGAGVRTAVWAPFDVALFHQLRRAGAAAVR